MRITILKPVLIVYALLLASQVQSQFLINEICSANQSIISDEDGDFEDFIEVYNAGNEAINLSAYYLTDDVQQPHKWRFPNYTLEPQAHRLYFASGDFIPQDNNEDHWETVVYAADTWKYFIGNSQPDLNWRDLGFDDQSWLSGPGGFGYADGDDATVIPQCYSIYLRKTFSILDADNIARCILNIDYDDGFVAYLNGVEIARAYIGIAGQEMFYYDLAGIHEAVMYQGGNPEYFFLDEQVVDDLLIDGENVLSIQVHNNTYESSDFSAIPFFTLGIIDNTFSYGVPPGWFGLSQNSEQHTSFSLAPEGETLFIFDEDYTIIDEKTVSLLQPNHTHARIPDGASWCVTTTPSPASSNNAGICNIGYATQPIFMPEGGFFDGSQSIYLLATEPNTFITYTIDGAEPSATSTLYTAAITLDTTVVLRARTFSNDALLASNTATSTYFINETNTLPVVALTIEPYDLWDWNNGLYVSGPNADWGFPFYNSNFWYNWERKAHMEYFDKERNFGFELDAGVKIHGGWSRAYPQKSFRILTRDEYGTSKINYQLFYDKNITSIDALNIRNAGIDWNGAHMRDMLMQKVAINTHMDIQNGRHCLMFLNGQYFGVFDVRERIDVDFIVENHPQLDREKIDIVKMNGIPMVGTANDFNAMVSFITSNDMSIPSNYEIASNWLDIENFCDYMMAEIYYINGDWLGGGVNNIKYWRTNEPAGKWRYILWDTDFGLGFANYANYDFLSVILNPWGYNPHSDMLNSLVANTQFKNYFVNRYADLINTIFDAEHFMQLANDLRDTIYTEMPRHFDKWGIPNTNPYGWGSSLDVPSWTNNYQGMLNFIAERPTYSRNHIQSNFNLWGQVDVTLNVVPAEAGHIQISTIIPDEYPWEGVYFNGAPVKMTAIANPGFTFEHWLSENLILFADPNQEIMNMISIDDTFTAHFTGSATQASVTISEINYHSDDTRNAGDWVELHNYGNTQMDISDWTFKDGIDASQFILPMPTILQPQERLVICFDSVLFKSQHPDVTNVMGNMNFTFENAGENLRLYNRNDQLIASVAYTDNSDWPKAADGMGRTLELSNPLANLSDGSNWFAGCIGGSPGEAFTPCNESIVFSEINYNSAPWLDAGDWVELRNVSNEAVDLSDWTFRDDDNTHCYELNFTLNPGENKVLVSSVELFSSMFPDVLNMEGPIGFNLGNSGEALRLFGADEKIYSSLVYYNTSPWPIEPDAEELTLELVDDMDIINNASSWFAGCAQGSPGEYFTPCEIDGLDEFSEIDVFVYPNPAIDQLNIQVENTVGTYQVFLFDMMGKEVMNITNLSKPTVTLDISGLSKGIYLLEIWNEQKPVSKMVVKK